MDPFEFRNEVIRQGLGTENPPSNPQGPVFGLLTNMSPIYTTNDPDVIMRILEIGRKYGSEYTGEHRAILSLYASIEEINEGGSVSWVRASYMNKKKMISMYDWLQKQKKDPDIYLR